MRITRRSPRVKFGNTTYTFGKKGISRSTKIGKHTRIGTTADGHRYISSRFLFWRIYQDLDELDSNASKQQIQQARNQRKNELSFWLLLSHPIVFFDHLLNRNRNQNLENKDNTYNQSQNPQANQAKSTQNFSNSEKQTEKSYQVEIFKDYGGNVKKVTDGKLTLKSDRILVSANVDKEIFYRDISDVFVEKGKIFVSSKGRNIPLIVKSADAKEVMAEIAERMRSGER